MVLLDADATGTASAGMVEAIDVGVGKVMVSPLSLVFSASVRGRRVRLLMSITNSDCDAGHDGRRTAPPINDFYATHNLIWAAATCRSAGRTPVPGPHVAQGVGQVACQGWHYRHELLTSITSVSQDGSLGWFSVIVAAY